jgi:hypothetical protein
MAAPEDEQDGDSDGNSGETESVNTRYPYTNDVAALGLVFGSMAIMALGMVGWADLSAIPKDVRLAMWIPSVMVSVVWLFGSGAAKTAAEMVGGQGQ